MQASKPLAKALRALAKALSMFSSLFFLFLWGGLLKYISGPLLHILLKALDRAEGPVQRFRGLRALLRTWRTSFSFFLGGGLLPPKK